MRAKDKGLPRTTRTILTSICCSECGKEFIPAYQHRYKLMIKGKTHTYCSYTCYRKVQKELEK